jgi:hypothetical protein
MMVLDENDPARVYKHPKKHYISVYNS